MKEREPKILAFYVIGVLMLVQILPVFPEFNIHQMLG